MNYILIVLHYHQVPVKVSGHINFIGCKPSIIFCEAESSAHLKHFTILYKRTQVQQNILLMFMHRNLLLWEQLKLVSMKSTLSGD